MPRDALMLSDDIYAPWGMVACCLQRLSTPVVVFPPFVPRSESPSAEIVRRPDRLGP